MSDSEKSDSKDTDNGKKKEKKEPKID